MDMLNRLCCTQGKMANTAAALLGFCRWIGILLPCLPQTRGYHSYSYIQLDLPRSGITSSSSCGTVTKGYVSGLLLTILSNEILFMLREKSTWISLHNRRTCSSKLWKLHYNKNKAMAGLKTTFITSLLQSQFHGMIIIHKYVHLLYTCKDNCTQLFKAPTLLQTSKCKRPSTNPYQQQTFSSNEGIWIN